MDVYQTYIVIYTTTS